MSIKYLSVFYLTSNVTITLHPQNSRKFLENSFKTKIDFEEINNLELAKSLAISQTSININIFHDFT